MMPLRTPKKIASLKFKLFLVRSEPQPIRKRFEIVLGVALSYYTGSLETGRLKLCPLFFTYSRELWFEPKIEGFVGWVQ